MTARRSTRRQAADFTLQPPAEKPKPPMAVMLDVWNGTPGLTRAAGDAQRARMAAARLREEPDIDRWRKAAQKVARSGWCRRSHVTIDFLLRPGQLNKILEGMYDDREAEPRVRGGLTIDDWEEYRD